MRILTGLATTLLCTPAILAQAPAPTLGQRLYAVQQEIRPLNETFQYKEALAKLEALIPATKPTFDKGSVNSLHASTILYNDLSQVYFSAYLAADNAGQWEKALDYITKAIETIKDNVAQGKDGLTEQRDYWAKKATDYQKLLDKNKDAVAALNAKTKLEDYEEGSMTMVKDWQKQKAEGEKWAKFFQNDMDLAGRNLAEWTKWQGIQDQKIKDQISDIEGYNAKFKHPAGARSQWVQGALTNAYLKNYGDKGDKIALVNRLGVLDPENDDIAAAIEAIRKGQPIPERRGGARGKKK